MVLSRLVIFGALLGALTSGAVLAQVSDLWHVTIPTADDACCFDYDGDGINDNQLATVTWLIAGISGDDPQADLDHIVEIGQFTNAFHWAAFPASGTGSVVLDMYPAQTPQPPLGMWLRSSGLGSLHIPPGTIPSRLRGKMVNMQMSLAGPEWPLPMAFYSASTGGPAIEVPLTNVRMTGRVATDFPTCGGYCSELDGLAVGGVVRGADYFSAQNTLYQSCACRGINPDRPVIQFSEDASGVSAQCTDNVGTPDGCGGETQYCKRLDRVCVDIPNLPMLFDIDTNENRVPDGISAGFLLSVAGTQVSTAMLDSVLISSFD